MSQTKSRVATVAAAGLDHAILETSSVVGTMVLAADARVVSANATMRRFLGLAQGALGRLTDRLVEPAWAALHDATPEARVVELRLAAADGTERALRGDVWSRGEGAAREIVAVLVDASDRQALRVSAQHGARMEALGSLTAGVAHDFNNLLTVLVGNLYLIGEELRDKPRVFEKLKAARDAGKRGTELIKQLLSFARREELAVGLIDPAKVIEGVVPLLRRALGPRITLETRFGGATGALRASAAQLESVVVNLAVNARDAIEGRGRIAIEVRGVDVREQDAALQGLARAGNYVVISVRDTGSGIPPEALARVFEPFFSTKVERGGTGLGLSMVRWFAEQAGGAATIDSVVGQGTTVRVWLPRQAEALGESNDKTMPLSTLPTGSERVVVLALDEALRATIHQTLEVLGYRVRVASGTEDMLAAIAAEPTELLVVDGLGRGDADVLIRARAAAPALRVLTTTDASRAGERIPVAGLAALSKPFSLADLASAVRRAIDSRAENV